jgi:tetratricopeptide (TPR) repeat protein
MPEGGGLAYAISILFLVIGGITQLVITPLHIIYVALLYLDVRVRKENLNLQPAHTPAPKVIEPVLIPATTTPSVVMPASVAPIIATPSSPPAAPASAMPASPVGSIATPAQKIGALFNRMRTEGPSADLLNDLGMAYMDVGDLGGALDAFTRARDLSPKDADIAYNLVLLHRARKDTPNARSMMQEYLRLETNPADVERVRADARFSDLI